MASAGDEKGRQTALSLLSRLAEDYPVYFVNGEHDHTPAFLDSLREAGVHVLDYTTETVTVGDTTLRLYGATSLYYSPTYDLTNEFTLDEEHYTILLAHIPNREKFAAFGTDLALWRRHPRRAGAAALYRPGISSGNLVPQAAVRRCAAR